MSRAADPGADAPVPDILFRGGKAASALPILFFVAGALSTGAAVDADAAALFSAQSNPRGLLHLVPMGIVIFSAIRGRHIIEAISWGLIAAIIVNVAFGLAAGSDMLVFRVAVDSWAGTNFAHWPLVAAVPAAASMRCRNGCSPGSRAACARPR